MSATYVTTGYGRRGGRSFFIATEHDAETHEEIRSVEFDPRAALDHFGGRP